MSIGPSGIDPKLMIVGYTVCLSVLKDLSLFRAIYVALARRLAASPCRSLNGVFVGIDFSAPLQHFSGSSVKIRHRVRWDVITELRTMRDGWG